MVEDGKDVKSVMECFKEKYGNSVYAICALDTGWDILKCLLNKKYILAEKMLIEGPECTPGNFIVHTLMNR